MTKDALLIQQRALEKDLESINPKLSLHAKIKKELEGVNERIKTYG